MSKLLEQLREALTALAGCSPPPALIGGLALAAHQVPRSTRDVDFLIAAEDAELAHEALLQLGYECVHRSLDASNYRRGNEGLDLLFAHRPLARRLLHTATVPAGGGMPTVSVEGVIGFKLQALTNAPERVQDLADIRSLVARHKPALNRAELRTYFELFGRDDLWKELLDAD